jgi:predicted TIM-barrel fold metal-dependent hydrolase
MTERTTYAEHRRIIDADSHVIELDDFLALQASEDDLALIRPMNEQTELPVIQAGLDRGRELFEKRQNDPATMTKFEDALLDNRKSGWNRLGAFDANERSHTLDLFGFEMQWVLPTFSFHQVAHVDDMDVLEAGARTLNKAMAKFCAADERLKAIGYLPLTLGPERSLALLKQGIEDGCYSMMVDTNEPDASKRSFTHPDFDDVWALFDTANRPVVNHVAVNGHYRAVSPSFRNNGKTQLELGGDAPAGELGLMSIANSAQLFLGAMIFDGVFDRHPGLRCISMEHAAFWLPSWLKSIEYTTSLFKRKRSFSELPIDTAHNRLKIAPFAGEPVGWIIDNVGSDLLVFASDYPHPEGTSDPIAKFEATMTECDEATMDKFYFRNMAELMGSPTAG